jgi:hypothetical protein
MSWLAASSEVLLAFVLAICCGALVEVFRNLRDIRTVLNLEDEPTPMELATRELELGDLGFAPALESEPEAIVVFLSSKCGTCRTIAEAFRGGAPETVWFVLSGTPEPTPLLETLAHSLERVIVDIDDEVANRIGVHVTPSVLTLSYGRVTRAQAVSSARQVLRMIPIVLRPEAMPVA